MFTAGSTLLQQTAVTIHVFDYSNRCDNLTTLVQETANVFCDLQYLASLAVSFH